MFPQPMSRSEFHPDDSLTDPTRILEEHLRAGFPADLALDLVLNEIVVRAAEATRASAAALALARGDDMVCRAATGNLAPDLGAPLNTRDGLSGACLETRQPQLSVDTEFDPRVDPAVSRRLGIRSILIVPVFESRDKNARFAGVLEVFSTSPAAFSHNDQKVLEDFAEECARIRQSAMELGLRKVTSKPAAKSLAPVATDLLPPEFGAAAPLPGRRPGYEVWTLALGGLAILATIAVSFLIGYRIGWLSPWLRPSQSASNNEIERAISNSANSAAPARTNGTKSAVTKSTPGTVAKFPAAPAADELVVYEKGKVVFRMKPAPKPDSTKHSEAKAESTQTDSTRQGSSPIIKASSTTKIAGSQSVWLSPTQAETRILSRTEPQYPPEARAARRSGNVVLEVHVAEDGSVSSIRTLSGDPLLAAAATEAVRNWRYQPYREHDHLAPFQTDVTLSFSLPN